MPKRSTLLKDLLRERHWQTYATFCRQYDDAARGIDRVLVGRWPSRGQFARWLSGDIKGLPHPDHCRVLEAMFPGYPVQRLFSASFQSRTVVTAGDPATGPVGTPSATPGSPAGPASSSGSGSSRGPASNAGSASRGGPGTSRGTAGAGDPGPAWPLTPPGGLSRSASIPAARRPSGPITETSYPPAPMPGDPRHSHVLHEEMAMTTEESARFVRGTRGGVDQAVLEQLDADVRQLAVEYLARPPLMLFRPLSQLRAEVFDMLDRRQRPGLLPPLYAAAGRLCALLAHASADLGHSYAAETHTRTAWLCADLADDDSLRAYIRWVQSNVAFWDGDYRQAAEIAHSGQRFATEGSNLLRLASQEARAWAACGEAAEVERTLAIATSVRDQHAPDDQAGVFRFDPGKAAYYASEVRLALGGMQNARLAVENAEEALVLFEQAPPAQQSPEFVAAARLDLANAHLALTDLDGAAEQLGIVLRLPVESRTQPIVGRVNAAANTLRSDRFTHSALAVQLREEIGLFRAYPARRDLSAALD
jgi:hypothetical protein